jgi:serine/threonine protein kinase
MNRKIGSGHFSIVKLAKDKRTGTERAVKIIKKAEITMENAKTLTREIEIIRRIQVCLFACLFMFVFFFCYFKQK